ncbi:MAG: hypothetical protein KF884_04525 [Fimbriimonadaceae bacterium]|nr:hypothetical protein [Fimbriimonadaceae bacterium]QYK59354.1 MAG: hypothetical protein KF884_04525 [Fimbriimonadaceae bacterium]
MTSLLFFTLNQDSALTEAGELVSKMFSKYHGAGRISGRSESVVEVGDEKFKITTELDLERPLRLRILQTVNLAKGRRFMVVSDGIRFAYDKPVERPALDTEGRLYEAVADGMTLGDMYRVASGSLAERNVMLDVAIADRRDLSLLRDQWVGLEAVGEAETGGMTVKKVIGQWRKFAGEAVSATLELWITPEGDLKRLAIKQLPGAGAVSASRVWEIDLKTGVDIDEKVFEVKR